MKKIIYILLFIFGIILFSLISGCRYKDCGSDLDCFKNNIKICEKATVSFDKNGVSVTARIRGKVPMDLCLVSFKINDIKGELAKEFPTDSKLAIGKTLNCELNYHLENVEDISELTENYDRCSGPLKLILNKHIKQELELIKIFNEILI